MAVVVGNNRARAVAVLISDSTSNGGGLLSGQKYDEKTS